MASTRRPTYKTGSPGTQGKSAQGKSAQEKSHQGGGRADVISASKAAPAAAAAGASRPSATDNVLSFPEPKGRRIRRNIILAACIVAALVAGLLAAAVYSPLFAIQTVSVDGTKMLTPGQVQEMLKPLHGKPLPQVNDDEVKQLLQPLVQVKDVTTEARPPSVLVVHIHERTPVALVKQGEVFQLVDVDGVQLGTTQDPGSIQLPVIDGGAGVIGRDLFKAITGVLAALPADVLARLSDASAKSVDAVELKLVDGQTIVWGNAGEKELKAKVLAALLKAPADPKNPVQVYDVSVPRHPVTR
ncbi:Polypeptide-transport-associated domain protein, FtsQ-type [Arthrobacter sp. FB24]|uniref:FtsQ-type POTRA domain-containing protein n=1 Tax=Arthrobacter sp. (strain FB24) TaxID=290399 RepID=UPI0000527012|nr:FtsQ-type POTRA domain-containing protein [Arthrobacter sp. FB24]ABK02966.1 Polypeptide-transport-associated domain protein, FtsQ-type [Arthrobacter sp. FB24]